MIEDKKYWAERPLADSRRDWPLTEQTWVDDYWASKHHPHRKMIIEAIKRLQPFESLLEIGCNCGPNLALLKEEFPDIKETAGVDINPDAIEKAKTKVYATKFWVADFTDMSFIPNKSYDIVLADAVLIYSNPEEIEKVVSEINRIARKSVVLVEWFSRSLKGVLKDFHWCRNYQKILENFGFEVKKVKITENEWPNKNWAKHGYIFSGQRK